MSSEEARVQALGALYAADVLHDEDVDTTKLSKRSAALATGVWESKTPIDEILTEHSTRWRIERMPAVDRNILRLGTYELVYTDVPKGVVISEAVELAKRYSTAKSGAFINGVLASVADRDSDTAAV
ncbi:MAG: transcription antitermination factor NusB [Acidimicrobiia bacterium]